MSNIMILSMIITFIIMIYIFNNQYFVIISLCTLCIVSLFSFNEYILKDWHINNSLISFNLDLSSYKASKLFLLIFSLLFLLSFYFINYNLDILPVLNNNFFINKEYVDKNQDDNNENRENIPTQPIKPGKPIPVTHDKKIKCFKSKINTNADNKLMLFYTTWCKFSKEICSDWEEFVESNQPNNLSIIAINCDDTENPPKEMSGYKIEGFPTAILHLSNGKKYTYDEKITAENLSNFIKYICDKEQILCL